MEVIYGAPDACCTDHAPCLTSYAMGYGCMEVLHDYRCFLTDGLGLALYMVA